MIEKKRVSFDGTINIPSIITAAVILISLAGAWFTMKGDIVSAQDDIEDVAIDIALAKLAFIKADLDVTEDFQIYFIRIESDITDLKETDQTLMASDNAQAVSLGKIEAGQEYIQRTLDRIAETLKEGNP